MTPRLQWYTRLAATLLFLLSLPLPARAAGYFRPPITYSMGPDLGDQPRGIALADVNHDGWVDMVTAHDNGTTDSHISVYLGGPGGFGDHTDYPAPSETQIAVADMNSDGHPDVIVSGNGVYLLYGYGTGYFGTPQLQLSQTGIGCLRVGYDSYFHAQLIAMSTPAARMITVNFPAPFGTTNLLSGHMPLGLAVADVDGNGQLDVAVACFTDNAIVLHRHWPSSPQWSANFFTVNASPRDVDIGDLDGDGLKDLVSADYGWGTMSVLLQNSDHSFAPYTSYFSGVGSAFIKLARVNSDTYPDAVVASLAGDAVNEMINDGTGAFALGAQYPLGGQSAWGLAVADLNQDGWDDVVVATSAGLSVLYHNQMVAVPGAVDPSAISLAPVWPNPAHGTVQLAFSLPHTTSARLELYDPSGRRIRSLDAGTLQAGSHVARWDGRDDHGHPVASGIYLGVLTAEGRSLSRRLVYSP